DLAEGDVGHATEVVAGDGDRGTAVCRPRARCDRVDLRIAGWVEDEEVGRSTVRRGGRRTGGDGAHLGVDHRRVLGDRGRGQLRVAGRDEVVLRTERVRRGDVRECHEERLTREPGAVDLDRRAARIRTGG